MKIHNWREASVPRFLMPHYWIVILLKIIHNIQVILLVCLLKITEHVERTEVTRGMEEIFRHHYFGDVKVDRKTILKFVFKMGHECLNWIALPQNKVV